MGVFLGALFFILMLAAGITAGYIIYKNNKKNNFKSGIFIAAAIVLFGLFVFIPFGFVQIEAGEVAVVKVWGEATEVKTAGLHFRNIITTKYEKYDIKTQQIDLENPVYTRDAQPADTSLLVQYSIRQDEVINIVKNYGSMEAHKNRITRVAQERTEVIITSYVAMDIIENRNKLSLEIKNSMKDLEDLYYININNVVLVDIAFSEAFEAAVEAKMQEQVAVERAEAEKRRAIIEAERDLEVAKLNAEKALAAAKGMADANIALAEGEAKALKLKTIEIARMLGFEIKTTTGADGEVAGYEIDFTNKDADEIKLISDYVKYITYLEVWDGKLPTVIADGSGIIIPMP